MRTPRDFKYCSGARAQYIKKKLAGGSRGFGFVEMPNKEEVMRIICA
jgi:hypothetical protein